MPAGMLPIRVPTDIALPTYEPKKGALNITAVMLVPTRLTYDLNSD